MKLISKIVLLGIFIYVLFLYRSELSGLIDGITSSGNESTVENASWAGKRKEAYDAYEFKDSIFTIELLENLLPEVESELRRHDRGSEGLVTMRRDVICELSLIHNKLSNKYYELGDEEKYYHHLTTYRSYLSQCTEESQNNG